MNYINLNIYPVYSEEHIGHLQIGLVRLLNHQIKTWEAFNNPEIDVIFNTAMTGDGKSLAAYLPALQEKKSLLAMYPTNELIQDQHAALLKYLSLIHI